MYPATFRAVWSVLWLTGYVLKQLNGGTVLQRLETTSKLCSLWDLSGRWNRDAKTEEICVDGTEMCRWWHFSTSVIQQHVYRKTLSVNKLCKLFAVTEHSFAKTLNREMANSFTERLNEGIWLKVLNRDYVGPVICFQSLLTCTWVSELILWLCVAQ